MKMLGATSSLGMLYFVVCLGAVGAGGSVSAIIKILPKSAHIESKQVFMPMSDQEYLELQQQGWEMPPIKGPGGKQYFPNQNGINRNLSKDGSYGFSGNIFIKRRVVPVRTTDPPSRRYIYLGYSFLFVSALLVIIMSPNRYMMKSEKAKLRTLSIILFLATVVYELSMKR